MTPYSHEYVERIEAENRAMREELDAAEKQLAEADARIAALKLAAQQDGPSGWRDMATAPKEPLPGCSSRWLLLFGDGDGFMQCAFIGYWGIRQSGDEECWRQVGWAGARARPTHWMPIPPPPTEAGTPALNQPPRSAERVALSITLRALATIRRTSRDEGARQEADYALAKIDALVPNAGDGP